MIIFIFADSITALKQMNTHPNQFSNATTVFTNPYSHTTVPYLTHLLLYFHSSMLLTSTSLTYYIPAHATKVPQ